MTVFKIPSKNSFVIDLILFVTLCSSATSLAQTTITPTLKLLNASSTAQIALTSTEENLTHLLLFSEASADITDLKLDYSAISRTDGQANSQDNPEPTLTFTVTERRGAVTKKG
jgi:hypothetical protein